MVESSRKPVFAKVRPDALPIPAQRDVAALTKPSILDKWGEDAAGIRAVAAGDNIITMFDLIGEDFWTGAGITAKKVSAQLRAIGDRPVIVQINSPGGDMFEGIAIYNVLREHSQEITVQVMGMAASAASIIAMAGDRVEIGSASFFMIHDAWVIAIGNRHDMAATAAWLEPFDAAMRDVYSQRTGLKADEIGKMMDAETWLSGSAAVDKGFADGLLAADKITQDDKTKAEDRRVNEVRAMELQLMASGLSRTQARERINKIKGTPGAVPEADTTDSVGAELVSPLADLLSTIRS
jgi:ATP-dependent Clp protease protease subunit